LELFVSCAIECVVALVSVVEPVVSNGFSHSSTDQSPVCLSLSQLTPSAFRAALFDLQATQKAGVGFALRRLPTLVSFGSLHFRFSPSINMALIYTRLNHVQQLF